MTQVSSKFPPALLHKLLLLFCLLGQSLSAYALDSDGDGVADRDISSLSVGYFNSCALDGSTVRCWGDIYGEGEVKLGPNAAPDIAVAVGYFHACALGENGVRCWGGENDSMSLTPPVLVEPSAISSGYQFSCALDQTGVKCWGTNNSGQLNIPSLDQPIVVSAGEDHACALDADGVTCWGDNSYGERDVPVLVAPVAISAGSNHNCAIDSNGVICWGDNRAGQLNVPTLVNPSKISAGENFSCALDATGVKCWGDGGSGQTTVPALNNPTDVSAGGHFACAQTDNGIICWGINVNHSINPPLFSGDNCKHVANPTQTDTDGDGLGDACDSDIDNDGIENNLDNCPLAPNPNQLDSDGNGIGNACEAVIDTDRDGIADALDNCPLIENITQLDLDGDGKGDVCDDDIDGDGVVDRASIAVNSSHGCLLDAEGVRCWKVNSHVDLTVPALNNPRMLVAGEMGDFCALTDDGVKCWRSGATQMLVPEFINPRAIVAGASHFCALDDEGVRCWGSNLQQQMKVPALVNPVAISAGGDRTCVIDAEGVKCWGEDSSGILPETPVFKNPQKLFASNYVSCVVDDNGLTCWGKFFNWSVSLGSLIVHDLVATSSETCVLTNDGIRCWQNGVLQQRDVDVLNPQLLSLAFRPHICALGQEELQCWNSQGLAPTEIPLLSKPYAFSIGSSRSFCVLDETGIVCWGSNNKAPDLLTVKSDNCPLIANPSQSDVDNDGIGDACDADVPSATQKYGKAVAFVGDFNGDGFGDYALGAPNHTVPAAESATGKKIKAAGLVLVMSGRDGAELARATGDIAKAGMGTAIAGNADIDGDGLMDVVIGAPNAGAKREGSVTVIYGREADAADRRNVIPGVTAKSQFGAALAIGDVDGVTGAEVIVGAPRDASDAGAKQAGSARIYQLVNSVFEEIAVAYGAHNKANAGQSVAVAKRKDDVSLIVIGAPNENSSADKKAGSVKAFALANPAEALFVEYGSKGSQFGWSIATADVNTDGNDDVVIGAPKDDNAAKKHKDAGSVSVFSLVDGIELMPAQYGAHAKAGLGYSVAAAMVNDDEFADIVAGSWKANKPTDNPKKPIKAAGSVTLWSGVDYQEIYTLYGDAANDNAGSAIAAGDINRDGQADIIVGVPNVDATTTAANGKEKAVKDVGAVMLMDGRDF